MRVNEIFYSVQGEGYFTGHAAIFIRLSGCNLKCAFCDTSHQKYTEMTEDEIAEQVSKYPSDLVVITGGEPCLQLTDTMVSKLHKIGKFVTVETNGTKLPPSNIDWVTVSPKEPYVGNVGKIVLREADEIKVVFDKNFKIENPTFGIVAPNLYVQPCDTGDVKKNEENYKYCVEFVKNNPLWKISLQTQKILNVR